MREVLSLVSYLMRLRAIIDRLTRPFIKPARTLNSGHSET